MQKGQKVGLIIISLLLSLLTTRGGLLNQTIAPMFIGFAVYGMFSEKTNRLLVLLLVSIIVLFYQYMMQLLAGGLPRLY